MNRNFFFFLIGCIGSLLLYTGFLQLRRVGATLCCGARASHCGGFSCYGGERALGTRASVVATCRLSSCGMWPQGTRASVVVACGLSSCGLRALECRLSSCGTWAQVLRGMWDLPGPGLEPVSPALAGGFLTTAPPGKSHKQKRFDYTSQTA